MGGYLALGLFSRGESKSLSGIRAVMWGNLKRTAVEILGATPWCLRSSHWEKRKKIGIKINKFGDCPGTGWAKFCLCVSLGSFLMGEKISYKIQRKLRVNSVKCLFICFSFNIQRKLRVNSVKCLFICFFFFGVFLPPLTTRMAGTMSTETSSSRFGRGFGGCR